MVLLLPDRTPTHGSLAVSTFEALDLILTRHTLLKNVLFTRSYQSADCETEHFLVCCRARMQLKKSHSARKRKVHNDKMPKTELVEKFVATF